MEASWWPTIPDEGSGGAMLISVLCIGGRSDWVVGKGGRHSLKLLEFEDHLDNAL